MQCPAKSKRHDISVVKQHVSTELKNRILAQVPELKASREGHDVLLDSDDDLEPICLARAAKIVWRDILNAKQSSLARSIRIVR